MAKKSAVTVLAFASLTVFGATADVVVENGSFRLVIGEDARARSLVVKATGEEMLDGTAAVPAFSLVQDRPFNNEIKLVLPNCETAFAANRVRREGDFLIVGFEYVSYEAKIRVTERDGYALFELVDFVLGPKGTDGLDMTYPPVRSLRFLNLPVRERENFGQWMNVLWDERGAAAVMAAEPLTWVASEPHRGFRLMFAEARRGLRMRGAKAVLVADGREALLDDVDAMEADLDLPRGVRSRRSPEINRSIYWTRTITPSNVDEHIALARKGGFRMMLVYFSAVCEGAGGSPHYDGIGDYAPSRSYPNGYESIREVLAKVRAAGITPGLHVMQTFIGRRSHYVTPIADPRLNLTRHFTLAKPLGDGETDLYVQENPSDCPTNAASRVLRFGGELLSYAGYVTERPYRFTGVRRGHWDTRIVAHERGQIGGILDVCEYGGTSCYIDQNSDLQDEVAEKIARIYDCGFAFLYCDGSEGVNVPQGIHVPNAQYRVWKRLAGKPLFMEGAAKAHFAWHHLSGANAFDAFAPEDFKAMIVRWPQYEAPILRKDFSRLNFGWWALKLPGEEVKTLCGKTVRTVGTQLDMWEFGTSRAAAWDCPMTVMFVPDEVRRHPRGDDLLEVLRRWEDVRARNWLTPEMKERLKSSTQEHHLYLDGGGRYELCDIEMLPTPEKAASLRGFLFARNGRRVVAAWHTAGTGTLEWALGPKTELSGLRYFETDAPCGEIRAHWAKAVLDGK